MSLLATRRSASLVVTQGNWCVSCKPAANLTRTRHAVHPGSVVKEPSKMKTSSVTRPQRQDMSGKRISILLEHATSSPSFLQSELR